MAGKSSGKKNTGGKKKSTNSSRGRGGYGGASAGRRMPTKAGVAVIVAVVLIIAVLLTVDYFYGPFYILKDFLRQPQTPSIDGESYSEETIKEQELSIHFIENGTKYTGDCELIKVGDTEVLIDAGAKTASIPTLKSYIDRYCTDGILEYVIITHAHEDHYAGFATAAGTDCLFDYYDCRTIITFSQITSSKATDKMYINYLAQLDKEVQNGAVQYTASQCIAQQDGAQRTYDLGSGVELEILDSEYYYTADSTENNHSVCCMLHKTTGSETKHYLFTGDLEKKGEEKLVQRNALPKVELYKAGHHGSKTSSNDVLLSVIQPKLVCVCCCAGSSEYTSTNANQFPTQDFVDRIAPYTQAVYVTTLCLDYKAGTFQSMNGNIVVCDDGQNGIKLFCSGNTALLKDTEWFQKNRTLPSAWKS